VAPNGAIIPGIFLKPNRLAHGAKFFTEAGTKRDDFLRVIIPF
jgi:hypothetical protein